MTTFLITSNADDGVGTLREAIELANGNGTSDTITFDSSLEGTTITLTTGELAILEDLVIDASSISGLTIDGNNNSRIFNVSDNTNDIIFVEFIGLTLSGGNPQSDDGSLLDGGAIFTEESLQITNSTISGNTSTSLGGGIFNVNGNLTLIDSTVSDNSSLSGGGIFNYNGVLIINESVVSDNNSVDNGGGIYNNSSSLVINDSIITDNSVTGIDDIDSNNNGGGVYNNNNGLLIINNSIITNNNVPNFGGGISTNFGNITITNTTISGNTSNFGGGLYAFGSTTDIQQSTISNNEATNTGGGIFTNTDLESEITTITNTTISGNTATDDGGGIFNNDGLTVIENSTITNNTGSSGGGIASFGDNLTETQIANTIISGNENSDVDFVIAGVNSFVSNGGNLIGIGNAAVEGDNVFTEANDITGITDPVIGPLENNGGFVETHALLAGSPAIDAGINDNLSPEIITDGRGEGFDRIINETVDIGAFEFLDGLNLDIDGNGEADALTDGILILRSLFGFTGDSLIDGALATDATLTTASEIEDFLEITNNNNIFDVDGNGEGDALTDGILILRSLFGFTDDSLINGAVATDATLTTASEISEAITSLLP